MINYLKSSISISSYNGCTINCKYCILSSLGNRENVRKVEDEKELVKKLLSLKLYSPEIPISVNNQTDPLLNKEIFNSTIKILKEMEKNEVPNPILIITKGYITEEQIKQIEKIDLNLIILYTFSGLSEKLENRNEKSQIETLKKLSKLQNCKLINYYRPVIEGINSDKETIEHIAKIVTKYCRASIVSGIRMNTHLKQIFEKNGICFGFSFLLLTALPHLFFQIPDIVLPFKDYLASPPSKYSASSFITCGSFSLKIIPNTARTSGPAKKICQKNAIGKFKAVV